MHLLSLNFLFSLSVIIIKFVSFMKQWKLLQLNFWCITTLHRCMYNVHVHSWSTHKYKQLIHQIRVVRELMISCSPSHCRLPSVTIITQWSYYNRESNDYNITLMYSNLSFLAFWSKHLLTLAFPTARNKVQTLIDITTTVVWLYIYIYIHVAELSTLLTSFEDLGH